ncbi:hypothetical protein ES703_56296 [subsurface metagenome]
MLRATSRCCTLYKEKDGLENTRDEILQRVCADAVKLFDVVLFPLVKRKNQLQREYDRLKEIKSEDDRKKERLAIEDRQEEQHEANIQVLKTIEDVSEAFTIILRDFAEMWPGALENPLKIFPWNVARIITDIDVEQGKLKERIQEFADQIPLAVAALRESNEEEWWRILQGLCTRDGSGMSSLCKIWLLLAKLSEDDAYDFLGSLFKNAVGGILRKKQVDGHILQVESHIAETVTGDILHLFIQCSEQHINDESLWEESIGKEASKLIRRHGRSLKHESSGMYQYLKDMRGLGVQIETGGEEGRADKDGERGKQKGIIDMRDKINFGDLSTRDGNIIVNIGGAQYKVEQIQKDNVLSAIAEVVKAGVSDHDITSILKALAPNVDARGDISEEEIVDTVKKSFEEDIEGDSERQKFMQVIKQVIIGASGSILGSGIIKGIKLLIGLPLP